MKYGIREICDVVLKAKARMKVGSRIFYKDEPVIYFDSLKTSTMEGAATTVYAQGGRGNSRLIAWEGERTVTFTMEDALISHVGLAILTGADVIDATEKPVIQHITETVMVKDKLYVKEQPYVKLVKNAEGEYEISSENFIYVMKLDTNGNIATEPYLYVPSGSVVQPTGDSTEPSFTYTKNADEEYELTLKTTNYQGTNEPTLDDVVLVDYYTERISKATQIEITPDKFGGNFYLEASTLFRDTNGVDMPAEFIIPNCKVQSNFTFSMASSGDPSTFTFTMDAFPDYTRFDRTKKVLSVIQIIEENTGNDYHRVATDANASTPGKFPTDDKIVIEDTNEENE